jgi:hypothetical protein
MDAPSALAAPAVPVAPPAEDRADAFPLWLAVGLGAVVVVGAGVAAAFALTGGGGGADCSPGEGGCLTIVLR